MPLPAELTRELVSELTALKLQSVVCAPNAAQAKSLSLFHPSFIAVEPPSLIGGRISISESRPSLIKDTVRAVGKNSVVLVGAGIHTQEDVARSVELGAYGVLVASGVVKSTNVRKELISLVKGLR